MAGEWRTAAQRGRRIAEDVEGFAILTLYFREANDVWTGECRELGTATDGATLKQVHEELVDLAVLHLNALEEAGERERFFEKHGIPFYPGDSAPKVIELRLPVDEKTFVHTHKIPLNRAA